MIFYIKNENGDFKPVGTDYPDMLPHGSHLIQVSKYLKLTISSINPDHATVLAAILMNEDDIIEELGKIISIRPNKSLTKDQIDKINEVVPGIFQLGTRPSLVEMAREIMYMLARYCDENTKF